MTAATGHCSACGAPIVFARQTGKAGARLNPIDAEPGPSGSNLRLFADDGLYIVIRRDEIEPMRAAGVPLHQSHFVTCPHADSYRRRAKARS